MGVPSSKGTGIFIAQTSQSPASPAATAAWQNIWLTLRSLGKGGKGINRMAGMRGPRSLPSAAPCIALVLLQIVVPPGGINSRCVSAQVRWLIFPCWSSVPLELSHCTPEK